MARDPVCGVPVEEETARKSKYRDDAYYFCSPACKQMFQQDPERYIKLEYAQDGNLGTERAMNSHRQAASRNHGK